MNDNHQCVTANASETAQEICERKGVSALLTQYKDGSATIHLSNDTSMSAAVELLAKHYEKENGDEQ